MGCSIKSPTSDGAPVVGWSVLGLDHRRCRVDRCVSRLEFGHRRNEIRRCAARSTPAGTRVRGRVRADFPASTRISPSSLRSNPSVEDSSSCFGRRTSARDRVTFGSVVPGRSMCRPADRRQAPPDRRTSFAFGFAPAGDRTRCCALHYERVPNTASSQLIQPRR